MVDHDDLSKEHGLGRREFIRLTGLGGAALLLPTIFEACTDVSPTTPVRRGPRVLGSSSFSPSSSIPVSAFAGSFAASTALGNQAVTGVGFMPKALIFLITPRTSAGTSFGAGVMTGLGRGWTDGTNMGSIAVGYTSNQGTAKDGLYSNSCLTLIDYTGTVLAQASIVSLDSDGFTINWTTAPAAAYLVTYLALGGAGLTSVKCGSGISPSTPWSISGLGFSPTALFLLGINGASALNTQLTIGGHGFGFGQSSSNRHTDSFRYISSPISSGSGLTELAVMSQDDGHGQIVEAWDLTSLDADGFTLTRTVGSALDQGLLWLAIRGPQFARGLLTQPAANGSQTISGLPFQPRALLFDGGGNSAVNAHALGSTCVFGFGTDSTHRTACDEGNETTNGWNRSIRLDTSHIVVPGLNPTSGAAKALADLSSMNADGFTLNWTSVLDSTARRYCYIAIGDALGGADMTTTPNMPAGLTVVQSQHNHAFSISRRAGDRDFRSIAQSSGDFGDSSNVGGSEGWDQPQAEMVTDTGASGSGGQKREIVTVSDAPKSGPQVARFTLKAKPSPGYSTTQGVGIAEIDNPGSSAGADRWGQKLYGAFWFRLSPNYYGDFSGNSKLFYVYGGHNETFVSEAYGSAGSKTGTLRYVTYIQGTVDARNNQQLPMLANYTIVRGVWYRLEVYAQMNSSSGVADGIFRSWITGVGDAAPTQVHDVTDILWSAMSDTRWGTVKSPDWQWGGAGGPLPEDIYIDYDHAIWATA